MGHIVRAGDSLHLALFKEVCAGAAICWLGPEPGRAARLLHPGRSLLPGRKALFVRGVSGQVICTQWEAEISFPHEISESWLLRLTE